jgi:hypothetical protein
VSTTAAPPSDSAAPSDAPPAGAPRRWAGWLRATHVWLGALTAVAVIVVSVTGIVLNHTEALSWGSAGPPSVEGSGAFDDALPVNDLLRAALREGGARELQTRNELGDLGPTTGPSDIDRAMFRPGTSTAQVRLKDALHTEVVLDWSTGEVLDVVERHDVRLEHLHSGEAFGQRGVVLSDVVAVVLVALAVGGGAIWIRRLRRRLPKRPGATWFVRANWWFHLVGGLLVIVYTVVLSVSGVILNHKREWGFMDEPARYLGDEGIAHSRPASLETIAGWAVDERVRRGDDVALDDVRFLDYRPGAGYAKVRFADAEWEVVVDVYEPDILSVSQRRDVWMLDLHSGVRFGERGTWLSDLTAGGLVLLTLNGLYLWLRPGYDARSRSAS